MSGEVSNSTISLRERPVPLLGGEERLLKWLFCSLLVHGMLIVSLFLMPFLPSRRTPTVPIYTVDLVGGEKIGGRNFGTELFPVSAPKEAAKKATETAARVPETKQEAKKEKTKAKVVEKEEPVAVKVALRERKNKETVKKESTQEMRSQSKAEEGSLDRVRERLIQSAVDRAKNRAESAQTTPKGEVISSGPGEGEGAAALGKGGRGGGVVKGMEFVIYQNRILSTIKDNWVWAGQRSNLKVIVHFGIKDNGEIAGLKIVQPSGDPSYDESVLRAVKKSSPLPAPPESYRKDFSDVELTFRPKDLGA